MAVIAAGAILRQGDSQPLLAFSESFRYDQTPLAVTSIAPAAGSTVALPMTTVTVGVQPTDRCRFGSG